jgi:hypothetical protein
MAFSLIPFGARRMTCSYAPLTKSALPPTNASRAFVPPLRSRISTSSPCRLNAVQSARWLPGRRPAQRLPRPAASISRFGGRALLVYLPFMLATFRPAASLVGPYRHSLHCAARPVRSLMGSGDGAICHASSSEPSAREDAVRCRGLHAELRSNGHFRLADMVFHTAEPLAFDAEPGWTDGNWRACRSG